MRLFGRISPGECCRSINVRDFDSIGVVVLDPWTTGDGDAQAALELIRPWHRRDADRGLALRLPRRHRLSVARRRRPGRVAAGDRDSRQPARAIVASGLHRVVRRGTPQRRSPAPHATAVRVAGGPL